MQEAFREHHGLQCGFMHPRHDHETAVDLVHRRGHDLSEQVIREEARGQSLPLHRLSDIVQSIAAGRQGRWRNPILA